MSNAVEKPCLALVEQVAEARVRLDRRPEPGELPHRPEPAPVHALVDPSGIRERPRIAEVAAVVDGNRLGRVNRIDLVGHAGSTPATSTYFTSRYSSIPKSPPSRPYPDSLTPPKGTFARADQPRVGADDPVLELLGDPQQPRVVARVEVGREPEDRVVRELDRLLLGVERCDCRDRAERLLVRDQHLARHVREHRRLVEGTAGVVAALEARSARQQLGAVGDAHPRRARTPSRPRARRSAARSSHRAGRPGRRPCGSPSRRAAAARRRRRRAARTRGSRTRRSARRSGTSRRSARRRPPRAARRRR